MFGSGNDDQLKELMDLIKIEKNESGDLVAYYPITKINNSSGVLFITTKGIAFITIPEMSNKMSGPVIFSAARLNPLAGMAAGAIIGLGYHLKTRANSLKLNSDQEIIIKLGIKYSPCFLSHCFKDSQFIAFKYINALIYDSQQDKQQNLNAKIIYNNSVRQDFSMNKEIMHMVIKDLSVKNQPTSSFETNNIKDLVNKAGVQYEHGEYIKAINICKTIFEFDPDNQKAFETKGASLLMLAKYEESISTCGNGIKINPSNLFLLNTKAVALEKLYRYREAMEIFAEILRLDPKNEQVRLNYEHAKSLIAGKLL